MNSIAKELFPMTSPTGLAQSLAPFFPDYQALRAQLMEIVSDEDLGYRVGGTNPRLGALCREIGEVEHSYVESLKTFRQDFGYRNLDPNLESSVAALSSWYAELDDELRAAIESLSEDNIAHRTVDRRDFPDFKPLVRVQLDICREALLIFATKVSVYLRAMGKELPQQWRE